MCVFTVTLAALERQIIDANIRAEFLLPLFVFPFTKLERSEYC